MIAKWNKHRLKYDNRNIPAAKDVLALLYKRVIEKEEGYDSLVIQCHQFYSHDELARIADYNTNPTIIHVLDDPSNPGRHNVGKNSGDKTFMWTYVKYLAKEHHESFSSMLSLTVMKLKGVTGAIFLLPKLAEISLLALLFMIMRLCEYV